MIGGSFSHFSIADPLKHSAAPIPTILEKAGLAMGHPNGPMCFRSSPPMIAISSVVLLFCVSTGFDVLLPVAHKKFPSHITTPVLVWV